MVIQNELVLCSHSMQQTALPTWHALTMGVVTTRLVQVCVCVGLHSLGTTAHNSFQVSGLASSSLCKCCMLPGCHVSHGVKQICACANCSRMLTHFVSLISPACVHQCDFLVHAPHSHRHGLWEYHLCKWRELPGWTLQL